MIKKKTEKRINKGCFFGACWSNRASPQSLCLADTQRQAGDWGIKGRLQVCPDWRLLPWWI